MLARTTMDKYTTFMSNFIDSINIIADSKIPGSGDINKVQYIKKTEDIVRESRKNKLGQSDEYVEKIITSKMKKLAESCYSDFKYKVEPELYIEPEPEPEKIVDVVAYIDKRDLL